MVKNFNKKNYIKCVQGLEKKHRKKYVKLGGLPGE